MSLLTLKRFAFTTITSLFLLTFSYFSYAAEIISSGEFIGENSHVTTGNVSIEKTDKGLVVVLAENFSFDGAPAPVVGLGKDGEYDEATEFGVLKSDTGAQRYLIPNSVKITNYNEVYIWCVDFSVSLGVAKLKES